MSGFSEDERSDLLLKDVSPVYQDLLERIRKKHGFDDLTSCFEDSIWRIAQQDLEVSEIAQAYQKGKASRKEGSEPELG
ncbi:hypothetical protein [Candidatus Thiodiazotropha sp. CDECU1]|uniref:hypothetical protein n=1 Tax=Candidatus Thiodiazotropha sp. CDECU1 TaxID=3065865 RepID=UPI002930A186|nr:hypothetical protein [Candidatus Thiodiazotropha sp. CDECU1]